jgi:transcriptional regulator MraZ
VLLGEFVQRLDAKNRVTLPAKFRPRFSDGVVVTKGWDGCLTVFNREGWESFVGERLAQLDSFNKESRRVSRFLYAGASETELDAQGRVMLPQSLLQHAGLTKDIVVAGMNDRLEIWDIEAWKRQLEELEGSMEDVAERLSQQ